MEDQKSPGIFGRQGDTDAVIGRPSNQVLVSVPNIASTTDMGTALS
jgi:hypothetical protein